MKTVDFAKSFLTFRIDTLAKPPGTVSHEPPYTLNNARIQLECVCSITEMATGWSRRYVLGASCKTERVGVERDIWLEPNADFAPIFSDDGFLNLKTYARAGMDVELYPPGSGKQSDRQTGCHNDVFDSTSIDVVDRDAESLQSPADVVAATLANRPLNARTTITTERYSAVIEYPVKTINANERDDVYQTDTGPVLLPDFTADPGELLARFELAYSAFNCGDWIEFIVREPTAIADGVEVHHYSRPIRFDARNEILLIG